MPDISYSITDVLTDISNNISTLKDDLNIADISNQINVLTSTVNLLKSKLETSLKLYTDLEEIKARIDS